MTSESYEDMVEREGGYYLAGFTSGYDPGDVWYKAMCGYCSAELTDDGDATYHHSYEREGRECWARRQKDSA